MVWRATAAAVAFVLPGRALERLVGKVLRGIGECDQFADRVFVL
jgi:hypothetical protein